ncbi:MAG: hypothetical protein WA790_00700 [Sulfitobacter sp.]
MSAPDTDIEKQEKRHKTPLTAMKGAVVVAVLGLAGFLLYTAAQTEDADAPVIEGTVPTVDTTVNN